MWNIVPFKCLIGYTFSQDKTRKIIWKSIIPKQHCNDGKSKVSHLPLMNSRSIEHNRSKWLCSNIIIRILAVNINEIISTRSTSEIHVHFTRVEKFLLSLMDIYALTQRCAYDEDFFASYRTRQGSTRPRSISRTQKLTITFFHFFLFSFFCITFFIFFHFLFQYRTDKNISTC